MLIGIPIYGGVDLLDVTGPHEMFSWADFDVQLFAQEAGLVTCRGGLPIYAATRFENAPAFDVLWVPGGDPDALARLMGDPERVYLDFLLKQSVAIYGPGCADVPDPIHDPKCDKDDLSRPGAKDTDDDDQFAGLKGVWKDTIFVKTGLTCYGCGAPDKVKWLKNPPADYYRFIIRTRYERYIGEFVLHCHILDHEDQGMMQNVQIGIPDGAGGLSHGHH